MMAYVDEHGNLSSVPPHPRKKIGIRTEDILIGIPPGNQRTAEDKTRQGIVSNFNEEKGYGFIRDVMTNESFFVHAGSLEEPGPYGLLSLSLRRDNSSISTLHQCNVYASSL